MKSVAFLVLLCLVHLITAHEGPHLTPYYDGQNFQIECLDREGSWGKGPTCQETGEEIQFEFGKDSFLYCGWNIDTAEKFDFAKSVIAQKESWQCRVAMSPDKTFFLPFTIPLWGVIESDHVHINYHMNFVFHGYKGTIMGVTAYPVRDKFQFARMGTVVNLHGPIKWMSKHTFSPFNKYANFAPPVFFPSAPGMIIIAWSVLSGTFTFLLCTLIYLCRLKPRLIKKYLKAD